MTRTVKITDSEINCQKCGKPLTPEVYWYGDVLQVIWYCTDCKCGYVRDVYFTGTGAPSYFEDANLTLGDVVDEDYDHPRSTSHLIEGCPTDEEIHLAARMADKVRLETWYEEHWKSLDNHKWSEGRGYGNFPKEGL